MKYVDIGFILFCVGLCVLLLFLGIYFLMGWTFIHDKLRKETKEDLGEKHGK